jgi:hypothetical protein
MLKKDKELLNQVARNINDDIAVTVYGPWLDASSCADSWELSKHLADIFVRLDAIEKQLASLSDMEE